MKLRRAASLATLALLLSTLATTAAFADTLTMSLAPGRDSSYGGGAFIATVSNGPLGGSVFDTFCLEYAEHFSPGSTYSYVINSKAVNGGLDPSAGGDPISIGTSYLYSKYLDDPAHATWTAQQQRDLQEAIWFLEDETGGVNNSLVAAAQAALGASVDLKADANGAYGVVALNLTNLDKTLAQDQLARVPEAGATLLLSMSLVGLGWFARRKNLLPSGVRPLNV